MSEPIVEDFAHWNVDDPDDRLSVYRNTVKWNHADRTKIRYVSKNLGRGNIANFEHTFDIRILEAFVVSKDHRGLLRFWECRNDWDNRIWISAWVNADSVDKWTMQFQQQDGENDHWISSGAYRFDLNVTYYVRITRKGKYCRVKVYSDPSNSILLEDILRVGETDKRYQYIWMCSTLCALKNQENWSSGSVENLRIGTLNG